MTDNRITALYCRYSYDDGVADEEHISIVHQKALLQKYADDNGFTNCKIYVDDGYSGTSFERPDFKRMLEDIENGIIGTIIVKDMSRFGRNYILVGQYVEIVLPLKNVRVIGVNDNYDSENKSNELFQFESILNEMYCADISKKVRTAKRAIGLSGQTMLDRPLYGYKLKPGTKREWIIDEEAADIVRMMFEKFVNEEWSEYKIAKYLRDNKVLSTTAYINSQQADPKNPYKWYPETVKKILGRQEYCGDTVNFKTKTVSYKLNKAEFIPREQWIIFPDTHPALISREIFAKAQKRLNREREPFPEAVHEYDTYFRGKCRCSDCDRILKVFVPVSSTGVGYNCMDHVRFKVEKSHYASESRLRKIFQKQILKLQAEYKSAPESIEEKLGVADLSKMKADIKNMEQRLLDIKGFMQSLFESRFNGEISADDFNRMSENYSNETAELHEKISETTKKYHKIKQNANLILSNLEYIRDTDFSEITKEICDRLIEKAVVGVFAGVGKINEDLQIFDYYIYGLGKINDLVDVRVKSYGERFLEMLPELMLQKKCTVDEVGKRLGIHPEIVSVVLKRDGMKFSKEVIKYKERVVLESIKNGLPLEEIYPLIGCSNVSSLLQFIPLHFGKSYRALKDELTV